MFAQIACKCLLKIWDASVEAARLQAGACAAGAPFLSKERGKRKGREGDFDFPRPDPFFVKPFFGKKGLPPEARCLKIRDEILCRKNALRIN